ncbi:hypothetical protein VIBNISFn135_620100 [Vibrio nigripulchritudo SFn135]|nr:hypothetical protein VIBNIBLFn1_1060008 [Vibrio nigripulchritudo BLFn1]CCO41904.1 hypothetical protein VIBNISFn135_620100 [Vibrio nigripulchritudo SFn135]
MELSSFIVVINTSSCVPVFQLLKINKLSLIKSNTLSWMPPYCAQCTNSTPS